MRSTSARAGILAAAVVAAVALFIVLNDDSDDGSDESGPSRAVTKTTTTATSPGPTVLTVRDGDPVGGVRTLAYDKGEQVDLEIRLNPSEEEIHVHGYEITKSAERSPVLLSFPARLDGIFDVEVHRTDGGDAQIGELRVNP